MHYAVRGGAQSPAQVLQAVRETCQRRQRWGDATDADTVLAALDLDPAGALAYAASVLAYEALPREARRRVKAERAFASLKEAMRGKEVTPAQRHYLQALRYDGAEPVDRAAASSLIDHLRQGKGGAA